MKESDNDWKYSEAMGFPNSNKGRKCKKVVVEIPAFNIKKTFDSVRECALFFNITPGVIYGFILRGKWLRDIMKFYYKNKNIEE